MGTRNASAAALRARSRITANRISGPLLDRIDLHVEAPAVEYKDLSSTESAEPSAAIRSRVIEARRIQRERFAHPVKRARTPRCPTARSRSIANSTAPARTPPPCDDEPPAQRPRLRPHPESLAHHRRPCRKPHHPAPPCDGGYPVSDAGSESLALKKS